MKRFAPATQRNRQPILDILRRVLPARGQVLEIAAGTGEHAAFFAGEFPNLTWQPTDTEPMALASIASWVAEAALPNLKAPLELDVCSLPWPVTAADAVVCINMIHISPWRSCVALCQGASAILPRGGLLYLYGPYLQREVETAPSNLAFDESLREQDPEWGLRKLEDVVSTAREFGLEWQEMVAMPANNLSVLFTKNGDSPAAATAGSPAT